MTFDILEKNLNFFNSFCIFIFSDLFLPWNSENIIHNSESKIFNSESKIFNSESKIFNSESKIFNSNNLNNRIVENAIIEIRLKSIRKGNF